MCVDQIHYVKVFKPGAPGFLELFLCGRLYVCMCLCVSAPEAINN